MSTLTSSPEGANDRLPTAAHRLEAIPLELSDLAVSAVADLCVVGLPAGSLYDTLLAV